MMSFNQKVFGILLIILMNAFNGFAEDIDYEERSVVCASCHTEGTKQAPIVLQDHIDTTVHEGTSCLECHKDLASEELTEDTGKPHAQGVKKVNCGSCHEDASADYVKHGIAEVGVDSLVPSCASCHGVHNIIAVEDSNSMVHESNLGATCASCHDHIEKLKRFGILNNTTVGKFSSSVHGMAAVTDSTNPARCKDCHFSEGSAHKIYSPGDHDSPINHFIIPKTCGKCHEEEEKLYWDGIHGKLTARGETKAPVCTSCHGEHTIKHAQEGGSTVSHKTLATATCTPCHNSQTLTAKNNLPPNMNISYIDEYHVKKSMVGDTTAANCASCHKAHDIKAVKDPMSPVNPANREKTCGTCHTDITQELAQTIIHKLDDNELSWWEKLFTIIYIILITATISGMGIYVLLDFLKAVRKVRKAPQVKRMTRSEIYQHAFLAVTFIGLVITGFALRFSDSFWAEFLFGRSGGFWVRHQIHVVSGVILVLTCLYHVVYLGTKRGTEFIKAIFPKFNDAKQAFEMVLYNLSIKKRRPEFDRFSFIEKVEYWALVWGMFIMTVTGFVLWFDSFFIQYIPKEAIDVMRVIHYYEAWLAALAILIWHMYSTVFNPHVYPMNPSWITGTMPKKQYEHEHGADQTAEDVPNKYSDH